MDFSLAKTLSKSFLSGMVMSLRPLSAILTESTGSAIPFFAIEPETVLRRASRRQTKKSSRTIYHLRVSIYDSVEMNARTRKTISLVFLSFTILWFAVILLFETRYLVSVFRQQR